MIKRLSLTLLAATAIGVVASQGALAADMGLPVKAPPVVAPPPLWNWTGLYVGGVFGLGISRNKITDTNNGLGQFVGEGIVHNCNTCTFSFEGANPGATNAGTLIGVGPQGGFTLDYKFQAPNSPVVWGIDGQFSFADLQGSTNRSTTVSASLNSGACEPNGGGDTCLITASQSTNITSQIRDIATIAGLFGIVSGPQDRTLWYVKGGGAWAKTKWQVADNFNASGQFFDGSGFDFGTNAVAGSFASATTNRWGWMVGTGVEWGLWGNWTAKIEYDFLDFGSYDIGMNTNLSGNRLGTDGDILCCGITRSFSRTLHVDQQIHLVQVGLNYKFDWGNWGHW